MSNNPNDPRRRQQAGRGRQPPRQPPHQQPNQQPQGQPVQGRPQQPQPQQGQGQPQGQMPPQSGARPQQGMGQPPAQGAPQPPRQAQQGAVPQQTGGMRGQPMGGQQPGQRMPSPVQLQPFTAEDVVEGDVVKAEPDTPVQNVVAEMADEDVGSVIVVDDGQPTGVLTDRQIALELEDSPDVAQQTAGDLAGDQPITATPDATMFDILAIMEQEGIRRVPIVDEDGQLQGVVSLDDVIVVLGRELGNAAETIENQIDRL